MDKYRMTVIDRLVLFGKKIEDVRRLSDQITIFAVSKPSPCLYYKFKYASNTQYHKIECDLIDEISKLNAAMKDLISEQV